MLECISDTVAWFSKNSRQEVTRFLNISFCESLLDMIILPSCTKLTRLSFWKRWAFSLKQFNHELRENTCNSLEWWLEMEERAEAWSPCSSFKQNISLARRGGGVWPARAKCFHVVSSSSLCTIHIPLILNVTNVRTFNGYEYNSHWILIKDFTLPHSFRC